MKNILILCTGNSCRSQMAHGYFAKMLKGKAVIYSAGVETHGVNPFAIKAMAEDGIDISKHTSNNVDEYSAIAFDYVITVCDHAKEVCPYFPKADTQLHQNFKDPASATGTEEEILTEFRATRDEIKAYAKNFTEIYFSTPQSVN